MNKALGRRHGGYHADLGAAAGLADYGDVARIASEVGNIVMDPLESSDYVEHADIAGMQVFLPSYRREIGISESVQTVVDRAEHYIAVLRQVLAAVAVLLDGVAAGETATMQPYDDRALAGVQVRRPDVQAEAVLAEEVIVPGIHEESSRLRLAGVTDHLGRRLAVIVGIAYAFPRLRLLRRHETVLAAGRGSVGDALELVDVVEDVASDLAVLGLSHGDVVANEHLLAVVGLLPLRGTACRKCQGSGREDKDLFHNYSVKCVFQGH